MTALASRGVDIPALRPRMMRNLAATAGLVEMPQHLRRITMSDREKTDDRQITRQGEPTYGDRRGDHLAQRSQWREDQHSEPPRPDHLAGEAVPDGERKDSGGAEALRQANQSNDSGDDRHR